MRRLFQNPIAIILIIVMAGNAIFDGRFSDPMSWLQGMLLTLPGIVIALSFHEFAHAFVAVRCGDDTPRLQGRVTLNPIAHFDVVGLIALIIIGFGWGKPVMINPRNFRKPRRDELLVSLAGVTMNFLLAFIFIGLFRLAPLLGGSFLSSTVGTTLVLIVYYTAYINIVLMIFNLLPIPPLDGFNAVTQIFNLRRTELYYRIYDNGFPILMVLLMLNVTGRVLRPAVAAIMDFLLWVVFLI